MKVNMQSRCAQKSVHITLLQTVLLVEHRQAACKVSPARQLTFPFFTVPILPISTFQLLEERGYALLCVLQLHWLVPHACLKGSAYSASSATVMPSRSCVCKIRILAAGTKQRGCISTACKPLQLNQCNTL